MYINSMYIYITSYTRHVVRKLTCLCGMPNDVFLSLTRHHVYIHIPHIPYLHIYIVYINIYKIPNLIYINIYTITNYISKISTNHCSRY